MWTVEQQKKILMVRYGIGDGPNSPFYPLFADEEVAMYLEANNWNVRKTVRQMAIAASMVFSQMVYRERTGDIEVWNNVSIQYLKALENIINENTVSNFGTLIPYFGGIDWSVVDGYNNDPNSVRSPLTQINDNLMCDSFWDSDAKKIVINVKKPSGEEWNGAAFIIP